MCYTNPDIVAAALFITTVGWFTAWIMYRHQKDLKEKAERTIDWFEQQNANKR